MINLNHTIDEINIMLHAIAKLPYEMVHELMDKIHAQAEPQVQAIQAQATPTPVPELTKPEETPQ